jgi:hypothetical protein
MDIEERQFLDYWFPRDHTAELFALSLALEEMTGPESWPVFAVVLSSLIISRGSGASRAMDLSRSRPHRVESKVPRSPFSLWDRQVAAFQRHYSAAIHDHNAQIGVGDARELAMEDESVDAIITSPPYLNAIDYMRTSKFSLVFLGGRLSELRRIRAHSIGTAVGLPNGTLPGHLDDLVERGVSDPRRRPLVRRYVYDLRLALSEAHRVLKPGRRALYVMGPSILSRREYDAAKVLVEIARSVGFHALGHGRRDLCGTRRSLPPPKRSARGESINRRMTCEFFVAMEKP